MSSYVFSVLALLVPTFIPVFQFGYVYKLWEQYAVNVSREYCTCSCWDTVFKAGYETGVANYKHVYFNSTIDTAFMWISTVISLVLLYEAMKKIFTCLWKGTARKRMVILFFSVIYSHYYAWWAFFNYINDSYYLQFWHQLLFTLTELLSSAVILHLIDSETSFVTARKILIIMSIALFHISASSWDQFVVNVIQQQGQLHQVLRDLGFMLPDILHIYLPWIELKDFARSRRRIPPSHLIKDRDVLYALGCIGVLWIILVFLK